MGKERNGIYEILPPLYSLGDGMDNQGNGPQDFVVIRRT